MGALAKADATPKQSEGGRKAVKYVYMLQSGPFPDRYYVGNTIDLKARFKAHNRGESSHTKKFLPWHLVTYIAFSDHDRADRFEVYLKSASGRTFAKRHF